ncbi:MAG: hypothetical protein HFI36_00590 [Bacilli bacterium]|jgi:hypothetical protein|nr:hypothetical protein [Bacilli bacterium]
MKTSQVEVNKLLDKLYNLRGSDSVVLKEMESERIASEATRDRTTEEKSALQDKIAELQNDSKELNEQGKKLIEVLNGIDKKAYETVIDRLEINFDPEALTEKLNDKLPVTIEKVNDEIARSEEELVKVEEEMNSAITKIEELGIRKDTAMANQEKLNEYFDLALSGNINITRDSITALLEQFDFSEEETREAAKILMFPEDGLYEYDNRLKETVKKSIGEVIKEAKSQEPNDRVETVEVEEEKETVKEDTVQLEKKEVDTAKEEKVFDKEDLIDLFNEIGLDYLDYTTTDLEDILEHFNEKVIRRNVSIFKNNELSLDVFVDNINLLYDKELEAKVDRLLRIGKSALDIYLNPTVLTKYDYRGLDKAIILLQNSGLDPKKVPLMAY